LKTLWKGNECRKKTKLLTISRQPPPVQITTYQKQLENLEYFNCLGSLITNDAKCTCEIKSITVMEKAAFNRKNNLFTSKLDLNSRTKLVKRKIWSIAKTCILRKIE
jgi:hypothetical protein